jgi:hypothetical protein
MEQVVEVNEDGTLYLPPELIGHVGPHTRFVVEPQGEDLLLRLEPDSKPFWATATPEERAKRFDEWVASHKEGPNLPDEALSRESIY